MGLAVPIGRTGLQHIVVDLDLRGTAGSDDAPATDVRLRAYGKKGLLMGCNPNSSER